MVISQASDLVDNKCFDVQDRGKVVVIRRLMGLLTGKERETDRVHTLVPFCAIASFSKSHCLALASSGT